MRAGDVTRPGRRYILVHTLQINEGTDAIISGYWSNEEGGEPNKMAQLGIGVYCRLVSNMISPQWFALPGETEQWILGL